MATCTGWEWLVLAFAGFAGFIVGAGLMSCCSCSAYDAGYEDALLDHGIPE